MLQLLFTVAPLGDANDVASFVQGCCVGFKVRRQIHVFYTVLLSNTRYNGEQPKRRALAFLHVYLWKLYRRTGDL